MTFLFFIFGDHPNFGQHNASFGVIYVEFSSYFQPDFETFKHLQVLSRACILANKLQLIRVNVISVQLFVGFAIDV